MATRTNVIECPHCGHEYENFQDYVDPTEEEADFIFDCDSCGKEFRVEMLVITTFKTTRI
jgi:DNA-directed RNA polymerase subunit RPC12/RpoP